jgi:hypothetical protein
MLAPVELPMSRSLQFASFVPRSGVSCVFVAALLLSAGSFSFLQGQSPTTTADSGSKKVIPATRLAAAPVSDFSARAAAPIPDPSSVTVAFGQGLSQPPVSPRFGGVNSRQWSRSVIDPFEPGPNFGNFSGSSGGMGFNAGGLDGGRQGVGGFNPMGGAEMGGRRRGGGPLFPNGSSMAGGSNTLFGPIPAVIPSLNQSMRDSFNLPFSSSTSNLQFNYQDALRPGVLGRPSKSMMFSTSDLGNGVFFSAGTSYGRSMGGPGSNASAVGRHSGPSVALKLSF